MVCRKYLSDLVGIKCVKLGKAISHRVRPFLLPGASSESRPALTCHVLCHVSGIHRDKLGRFTLLEHQKGIELVGGFTGYNPHQSGSKGAKGGRGSNARLQREALRIQSPRFFSRNWPSFPVRYRRHACSASVFCRLTTAAASFCCLTYLDTLLWCVGR
jgi:hypothetical protein